MFNECKATSLLLLLSNCLRLSGPTPDQLHRGFDGLAKLCGEWKSCKYQSQRHRTKPEVKIPVIDLRASLATCSSLVISPDGEIESLRRLLRYYLRACNIHSYSYTRHCVAVPVPSGSVLPRILTRLLGALQPVSPSLETDFHPFAAKATQSINGTPECCRA